MRVSPLPHSRFPSPSSAHLSAVFLPVTGHRRALGVAGYAGYPRLGRLHLLRDPGSMERHPGPIGPVSASTPPRPARKAAPNRARGSGTRRGRSRHLHPLCELQAARSALRLRRALRFFPSPRPLAAGHHGIAVLGAGSRMAPSENADYASRQPPRRRPASSEARGAMGGCSSQAAP